MYYALIKSGIDAKRIQRVYHLERESLADKASALVLQDQISFGEIALRQIDKTGKLPSRQMMLKLLKEKLETDENLPPT